jgi:hypothetical protein
MEQVEDFWFSIAIKTQLGSVLSNATQLPTDTLLYKRIHGYDAKIPNGIVSV